MCGGRIPPRVQLLSRVSSFFVGVGVALSLTQDAQAPPIYFGSEELAAAQTPPIYLGSEELAAAQAVQMACGGARHDRERAQPAVQVWNSRGSYVWNTCGW